jgi:hypothetical protein
MVNQTRLAYLHAKMAKDMPYPQYDILFIDEDVYKWQIDDEIASTAFYLHRFDEGLAAANSCLSNPLYPESERPRMQVNINLYHQKMAEAGGMLDAMRKMQNPQVPTTTLSVPLVSNVSSEDEAKRRENLKRLLNRKKDRKAKSR